MSVPPPVAPVRHLDSLVARQFVGAWSRSTVLVLLAAAVLVVVVVLLLLPARRRRGSRTGSAAPAAEQAAPPANAAVPAPADGPGIAGRVQGPGGQAVAGAVVTVTDLTGDQVARACTDAAGRYRTGLPTGGTYVVICAADSHRPVAAMASVAAGEVRRDLVLTGGAQIEGWVRRRGGEPVGAATVTLTDVRGEVVGAAVTGADGRYVLAELYPGEYTLTVTAERTLPVARAVVVDGVRSHSVDVVLRPNVTMAGTVRAARSGTPIADAWVTLVDAHGNVAGSTLTADDGRYEFGGLAPGTYTLTASGYAPVAHRVSLSGERTDRDLVLGDRGATEVSGSRDG